MEEPAIYAAAVSDLEMLSPDRTLELEGRAVTVRAFRFIEGLRATPLARPIVADLRALAERQDGIAADDILDLLSRHAEVWLELIALATGESVAWLRERPDEQAIALAMTFWQVNAGFFMTRLGLMARLAADTGSAPSTSSPSSVGPDMAAAPKSSPSDSPGASSGGSTNTTPSAGGSTGRT